LDSVLREFSDEDGVNEKKAVLDFLVATFQVAGINLKERSIRAAVSRFRNRGKPAG
jgi:hypothetical protein